jgi:hypothetical protein
MACGRKEIAGLLMLFAVVLSGDCSSSAAPQGFGPFKYDNAVPTIIILDGEIDERSALNFRQVLRTAKQAKTLILKSPGGLVSEALLIADDVQQRDLATLIPPDAQCFSACAFIFLAGADRTAMGALGVHQISSDLPDLERAQLAISDIIDALDRFGAPAGVLTTMFRTSADQMHVFSQEEIVLYGINRNREPAGGIIPQQETKPEISPDVPKQVTPDNAKTPIGSDSLPQYPPVPEPASRPSPPQELVFYQEKIESDLGTSEVGSVSWSMVNERGPHGGAPEPTIQAQLEIPGESVSVAMIIRRNDDPNLPASHVIEMKFKTPDKFPGITTVQRLAMKVSEEARGDPLIGVAGRVSHNSFVIALNNLAQAEQSNLTLLQDRPWIDIPIAYSTGRRALISIHKGSPGDDVFTKALRIWGGRSSD